MVNNASTAIRMVGLEMSVSINWVLIFIARIKFPQIALYPTLPLPSKEVTEFIRKLIFK